MKGVYKNIPIYIYLKESICPILKKKPENPFNNVDK